MIIKREQILNTTAATHTWLYMLNEKSKYELEVWKQVRPTLQPSDHTLRHLPTRNATWHLCTSACGYSISSHNCPFWKQPIAQKTTLNILQKAKVDLSKGKDIPDYWLRRFNIINMSVIPKLTYKLSMILTEINNILFQSVVRQLD